MMYTTQDLFTFVSEFDPAGTGKLRLADGTEITGVHTEDDADGNRDVVLETADA